MCPKINFLHFHAFKSAPLHLSQISRKLLHDRQHDAKEEHKSNKRNIRTFGLRKKKLISNSVKIYNGSSQPDLNSRAVADTLPTDLLENSTKLIDANTSIKHLFKSCDVVSSKKCFCSGVTLRNLKKNHFLLICFFILSATA